MTHRLFDTDVTDVFFCNPNELKYIEMIWNSSLFPVIEIIETQVLPRLRSSCIPHIPCSSPLQTGRNVEGVFTRPSGQRPGNRVSARPEGTAPGTECRAAERGANASCRAATVGFSFKRRGTWGGRGFFVFFSPGGEVSWKEDVDVNFVEEVMVPPILGK